MLEKKDTKGTRISTILGNGTEFEGNLTVSGSVRLDGTVNGDVKVGGALIVGAAGQITGNVEVYTAVIGGEVTGNIIAEEKVELIATAKLLGDITTKVIVIDENAVFQGRCDMNQEIPDKRKRRSASVKAVNAGKKTAKAAIQEALREVEEEERLEALEHKIRPEDIEIAADEDTSQSEQTI